MTNCFGAKPGASGTASRSVPRCGDISHSAVAEKSHSCRGSKSPGPRLTCGAACAMEWKWSCGGGRAPVRLHPGVRGASVDEESCPEKQPDHEGRCSSIPPPADLSPELFKRRYGLEFGRGCRALNTSSGLWVLPVLLSKLFSSTAIAASSFTCLTSGACPSLRRILICSAMNSTRRESWYKTG
jgi:hypothetical protein